MIRARRPRLTPAKLVLSGLLGLSLGLYAYHVFSRPERTGVKAQITELKAAAAARRERAMAPTDADAAGVEERARSAKLDEVNRAATDMFDTLDKADRAHAARIAPLSPAARAELADPAARARLADDIRIHGIDSGQPSSDRAKTH